MLRQDVKTMERLIPKDHNINIPKIKYNYENFLAYIVICIYLSAKTKYILVKEM